jgi:peptidoglycan/LPS O-acetylase OafA/YrhL
VGTIRLLLAAAVVLYHSFHIFGLKMTGGVVSVQAFYMISGFYMALILNEKYTARGDWKLFLTNRFLRIYPVYWVVLILVLIAGLIHHYNGGNGYFLWAWFSYFDKLHWFTIVVFILINIFLFGGDWIFFSKIGPADGLLHTASSAYWHKPHTFNFLLVPQAWSIGAELSFYLLAPLLVKRRWWIQAIIIAASLFYRYWLITEEGKKWDPWNYRFFPNEIALFMLGSLAWQIYNRIKHIQLPKWSGPAAWSSIIVLILSYNFITFIPDGKRMITFYGLFFLLLPIIFIWSKDFKIDRWLGELSFPLYIGHLLIIMLLRKWYFGTDLLPWFGVVSLALSLVFAWLLMKFIAQPVERIRAARVAKRKILI